MGRLKSKLLSGHGMDQVTSYALVTSLLQFVLIAMVGFVTCATERCVGIQCLVRRPLFYLHEILTSHLPHSSPNWSSFIVVH